jgi:NitT/TauT family transport system ATP-binding protein
VTLTTAVSANELSKGFEQATGGILQILDRFSLTLMSGEIICLFGANGCGKTTLFRVLGGIDNPDSGSVTVCAVKPSQAHVGYIPQSYGESLFPWMTLVDNVAFPLRVRGIGKSQARTQAADKLHEFTSDLVATKYSYQYSGGQKQVAAVARALVSPPMLLLADEPFSALDHCARLSAQDVFLDVVSRLTLTVLTVTHDVKDAIYIADRVLIVSGPPLRVVDDIVVNLPRPRPRDVRSTTYFLSLVTRAIQSFVAAQP